MQKYFGWLCEKYFDVTQLKLIETLASRHMRLVVKSWSIAIEKTKKVTEDDGLNDEFGWWRAADEAVQAVIATHDKDKVLWMRKLHVSTKRRILDKLIFNFVRRVSNYFWEI